MKIAFVIAVLLSAAPLHAEKITAYWRLEPLTKSGAVTATPKQPFLQQRMLPVKLARLSSSAKLAAGTASLPTGALLFEVTDRAGNKAYCAPKDPNKGSLGIPILNRQLCLVDTDSDGRFDAGFSVFQAYTLLSPPQVRGDIGKATSLLAPAAFAFIDPKEFPVPLTISYTVKPGKTFAKTKLHVVVERPRKSDFKDLAGVTAGDGLLFEVLGTLIHVKSISGDTSELDVRLPPEAWVYAVDNGTVFVPQLPKGGSR